MFLWERFGVLSPRPVEFEAVKSKKVVVDVEEKEKTTQYKRRSLRWPRVKEKAKAKKTLSKLVDVKKNYNFGHTHKWDFSTSVLLGGK